MMYTQSKILPHNNLYTSTGQEKKKVLIVITKSNFGGAQRYVYDLACTLHTEYKDSYEVIVAFGGRGALADKLEQLGIRTIEIPDLQRDISILKEFRVAKNIYTLYKNIQPDIVHLNSSKIGGIGAFVGRIARIKKILFTGHGWAFNEPHRSRLSKVLVSILHVTTIILCHRVIAVSEQTKKQICSLPFVNKKKIIVIHNGIQTPEFLDKDTARDELWKPAAHRSEHEHFYKAALRSHTIWIGCIGELHPVKGYDTLLEAACILRDKNINFFITILGSGELRDVLKSHIHKSHLDHHVFLLGYVPDASKYMKAFDVFVLPSKSEALPYVIIEAMHAQIPILASRVGGVPELIDDRQLFNPNNASDITQQIEQQILHRTHYTYNTQQLSIDEMVKKTIEQTYQ